MKFSDETLMAYAEGELDDATRGEVERAIRADPSLAAKVRQHAAMRANIFAKFSPSPDERVPPQSAAAGRSAKVIQLNVARPVRATPPEEKRRWSWGEWCSIVAALVVGVVAGGIGVTSLQDEVRVAATADAGGTLLAQGELAEALATRLSAAAVPAGAVRIGVSFEAKGGGYCRTFMMGTAAGLACANGAEWRVPLMAEAAKGAPGAGREMPPVVLDAIDERIAGQTLDAEAEEAARERGWKR